MLDKNLEDMQKAINELVDVTKDGDPCISTVPDIIESARNVIGEFVHLVNDIEELQSKYEVSIDKLEEL